MPLSDKGEARSKGPLIGGVGTKESRCGKGAHVSDRIELAVPIAYRSSLSHLSRLGPGTDGLKNRLD